ncbi:MAG: cytochrome ubiquinol oxidase subunit I [Minisyncoccia bacterium]|jgi:cytochrome d ubiquinol oxidase subunit I
MGTVDAARGFLGMTMAFHIFFALFGVGIPLMASLAELIGIIKKDKDFITMARRWVFAMTVLFVVGAISGTIVSVVFVVLLPPFMAIVSKAIILPFNLETYAFFLEAIFLGIYAYTWDRFKTPWIHWLTSLPIIIGSLASAFFITTVNAFMSTPQGFTDINGVIANVNQWTAMFNPTTSNETTHSILAYYATTAFVFAAVAAFQFIRKGKIDAEGYRKKMLVFSLLVAIVFSLAVVVSGDTSARSIAHNEPEKFATMEGVMQTESDAPLTLGGITTPSGIKDGIRIPGMLSFLVGGSRQVIVIGLNAFDPSTWPELTIHYYFDGMAVIGFIMLGVPILFFALWEWRRRWAFSKIVLWAIWITGVLSIIGVELGWMLTEEGRQPYTIRGFLLTANAFTNSPVAIAYAVIFPILYIVLSIVTPWVLVSHYRKHRL